MSHINEYGHPTHNITKTLESEVSNSINASLKLLYSRYKLKLDENGFMDTVIISAAHYSFGAGIKVTDDCKENPQLAVNALLTYQEGDEYDDASEQVVYWCEYGGNACSVKYGKSIERFREANKDKCILALLDDDLKYIVNLPD